MSKLTQEQPIATERDRLVLALANIEEAEESLRDARTLIREMFAQFLPAQPKGGRGGAPPMNAHAQMGAPRAAPAMPAGGGGIGRHHLSQMGQKVGCRPGWAALRLRPAEWWSFLDTMQVSYLIMLP